MNSIIKNQLSKALSQYFKDMTPDRFSLSFFRGEASLHNLEFKQSFLQSVLMLPSWLILRKASCSTVSCKMSVTRLKSVPVKIAIENVQVTLEGLSPEDAERAKAELAKAAAQAVQSGKDHPPKEAHDEDKDDKKEKYGTSDIVADGMALEINNIVVTLACPDFTASIDIIDLDLRSTDKNWQPVDDLRAAAETNTKQGFVQLYKALSLGLVRFRVFATAKSLDQEVRKEALILDIREPSLKLLRRRDLADNNLTLGFQWHVSVDNMELELSKYQIMIIEVVLASFKRLIREHNIANRNKHLAEHSGELPPQPASSAQATAQSKPAKTPPKANSGEAETSQTAKGAPQASSAPAPAASTGSSAATEHASAATSSAIHRPRRDPRALPDIFQFYIKNTAASLREPLPKSRKQKPRVFTTAAIRNLEFYYKGADNLHIKSLSKTASRTQSEQFWQDCDAWLQTAIGVNCLTHARQGLLLASTMSATIGGFEMRTDSGRQVMPRPMTRTPSTSGSYVESVMTVDSIASETSSLRNFDIRAPSATLSEPEQVDLLQSNVSAYPMEPDTPVFMLHHAWFSWSDSAGRHFSATAPPPPALFFRLHPIKLMLHQVAVMKIVKFLESATLAGAARLVSDEAKEVEKAINSATTLEELQGAGRLFGRLREEEKLSTSEITRLRIEYERRLDVLEASDHDGLLQLPATKPSDVHAAAAHNTHGSPAHAVPPADPQAFLRIHAELIFPAIEIPQLLEGPPQIRQRSMLATASKIVFTNTQRCYPMPCDSAEVLAAYQASLHRATGDFPWRPREKFRTLPPLELLSKPPKADEPWDDNPKLSFVYVERLWVDSYLQDHHKPLVKDTPVMIWLATTAEPAAPLPKAANLKPMLEQQPSSFTVIKCLEPVRVHINDQELLFLTRVFEDAFRNQLLLDTGAPRVLMQSTALYVPRIQVDLSALPPPTATELDWDILRSVQEDGLLGSAIGCVTLAETHLAQLQYDRGFVMAMMAAEFAIKLHDQPLEETSAGSEQSSTKEQIPGQKLPPKFPPLAMRMECERYPTPAQSRAFFCTWDARAQRREEVRQWFARHPSTKGTPHQSSSPDQEQAEAGHMTPTEQSASKRSTSKSSIAEKLQAVDPGSSALRSASHRRSQSNAASESTASIHSTTSVPQVPGEKLPLPTGAVAAAAALTSLSRLNPALSISSPALHVDEQLHSEPEKSTPRKHRSSAADASVAGVSTSDSQSLASYELAPGAAWDGQRDPNVNSKPYIPSDFDEVAHRIEAFNEASDPWRPRAGSLDPRFERRNSQEGPASQSRVSSGGLFGRRHKESSPPQHHSRRFWRRSKDRHKDQADPATPLSQPPPQHMKTSKASTTVAAASAAANMDDDTAMNPVFALENRIGRAGAAQSLPHSSSAQADSISVQSALEVQAPDAQSQASAAHAHKPPVPAASSTTATTAPAAAAAPSAAKASQDIPVTASDSGTQAKTRPDVPVERLPLVSVSAEEDLARDSEQELQAAEDLYPIGDYDPLPELPMGQITVRLHGLQLAISERAAALLSQFGYDYTEPLPSTPMTVELADCFIRYLDDAEARALYAQDTAMIAAARAKGTVLMDVEKTVVKMERKAGGPLQIEVRSRSSLEPRQSLSVDATPSPQGATSAELTPREKAMQEEINQLRSQLADMKTALSAAVGARLSLAQAMEEVSAQLVVVQQDRAELDERLHDLAMAKK